MRLALLVLVPCPVLANSNSIAILELHTKDLPPALLVQVQKRLMEALKVEGYKVIDDEMVANKTRALSLTPGCTIGPCLSRLGRALKVDRAVLAGVASQGSSYDLLLTMLETGGGTVLAQVSQRCEVCTFKEVEAAMIRAAEELHRKTLVFLATRGKLMIKSKPEGASVLLDSLLVGQTPLAAVVSPGYHLVEIAAQGGLAIKKELYLEPGKTQNLYVNLWQKLPLWTQPVQKDSPSIPYRPWVKWTVLGSGALLGGLGAGLWTLDGQETTDPRYLHDTRSAGITLVSLGAAAVFSAAVLYLFELKANPRPPRSLPQFNVSLW